MTLSTLPQPVFRLAAAACAMLAAACGGSAPSAPPVATPTVTLNHENAPAGSPLDITYRFVVANDAPIGGDYRVMVHVVDADQELMWTFDHDPPVPTSQWKPGQTIEYTRTEFVPVYPYVGEAAIHVGLYSINDMSRLPLAGEHVGQSAYRVARLQLQPQSANLLTIFKEGWHPAETALDNASEEWQWTRREATLAFKNPQKDAVFYLLADSPGADPSAPPQVLVLVEGQQIDQFTLTPAERMLRKVPLTTQQIGTNEMVELQIRVDKTFVPAKVTPGDKDTRELGIRVFHAFVDAR